MTVVIVGLGAIGGVYATALHESGMAVKIALDKERYERYICNPFIFNGKRYDLDYFTPQIGDELADLVIIATKWHGYRDALELISPIVGPHTQILPLLNGITSENVAIEIYGKDRVLYGYFIGHTATRIGRESAQDGRYITVFGERHNDLKDLSPRVKRICNLFYKANIKYRVDQDMEASLWQKFIINIGLNQVTAVLRKPYGEIRIDQQTLKYTKDLMSEAASIAIKLSIKRAENMVAEGLLSLDKMRPEDSSSMLQDVEAGRQTEVDMFAGEVCRLGEALNIDTPLNKEVLNKLRRC